MVLSASEKKRREEIERELAKATELHAQRRGVIQDQAAAQKRAAMREGTDKVAIVHREYQTQKTEVDKWVERAKRQVDREYRDRLDALSQEKNRLCLLVEGEVARAVQRIEEEERVALAPLEAEWEQARKGFQAALNPPVQSVPAEQEDQHGNGE